MAFVLLNESICSTMLLPFVGLLVAHLKDVSVNEAGYFSGILIGVFMLGQVVSSRMWGWVSDKYGRRFPLISGLFTSGFMMLGFGLSTSVWMCGIFRFMHGLFNGNVFGCQDDDGGHYRQNKRGQGFCLRQSVLWNRRLDRPHAGWYAAL
ncbi:Major Facilitator Superfamily/Sugar (and other) transporter, putative [Leishmania guyanensis]